MELDLPARFPAIPAPSTSFITVSSTPTGADILLDNVFKRIIPRTVTGVATGEQTVTIRMTGYAPYILYQYCDHIRGFYQSATTIGGTGYYELILTPRERRSHLIVYLKDTARSPSRSRQPVHRATP
jgi:hypothetical protein